MKSTFILLVVAIFIVQYCIGNDDSASTNKVSYSRCDPKIVNSIKELWQQLYAGPPKNLIEKAIKNGREVVVGASHGYYGDDLGCLSSIIYKDHLTTDSVYKNGTCIQKNVTLSQREGDGRTVSSANGVDIYRYHVIEDDDVTGVYTCVESGADPNADDVPDGFVKIPANKVNPEAVNKCLAVMEKLGISITAKYPSTCECFREIKIV